MPMHYVVSAHGGVNFNHTTAVPPKVKVLFYQPFGQGMNNGLAKALQSALCSSQTTQDFAQSAQVLNANPPVAMWQASGAPVLNQNAVHLTPDTHNPKWFKSGIVRALDNAVVHDIDANGAMSLAQALAAIASDAQHFGADGVVVHCLFCL